ncbi:MAG: hypothetical protein DWI00_09185 [Planctomycetota bacterium]|nr:MAG: hypothetical protein DWI00_09185 [Planctomycetota bacterium]
MPGHAARPQIDGLEQSNGSDEVRFHNWLIQQIAAQKNSTSTIYGNIPLNPDAVLLSTGEAGFRPILCGS